MSKLIGVRELCDIAGLNAESPDDVRRVVGWLLRNEVPYVRIGRNTRGYKAGILIAEDALVGVIEKRQKVKAAKKRAKKSKAQAEDAAW